MKNQITRYDKKKLRALILCLTNNPECRKSKYSKKEWSEIKRIYIIWFKCFKHSERKAANTVK